MEMKPAFAVTNPAEYNLAPRETSDVTKRRELIKPSTPTYNLLPKETSPPTNNLEFIEVSLVKRDVPKTSRLKEGIKPIPNAELFPTPPADVTVNKPATAHVILFVVALGVDTVDNVGLIVKVPRTIESIFTIDIV